MKGGAMNFTVIYVSQSAHSFTNAELNTLSSKAASRNAELDITGLLLYSGKYFLQILEGDYNAVNTLFSQITSDTRHHSLIVLTGHPATERLFPKWSMGVVDLRLSEDHDAELYDRICTQSYPTVNDAAIEALKLFKRKQRHVNRTQESNDAA